MSIQEQQLAQARENSTNAVSVYSPGASETAVIKLIEVVNTSGAAATVRLFMDNDGTTYDESTAIGGVWDTDVPVNGGLEWDGFRAMNNSAGNLAYRSSVANALTITVHGAVITP